MRTEIKVENSAILILVWMKCVLCGTDTLACARVESEGGRHRQGPHLRAAFAREWAEECLCHNFCRKIMPESTPFPPPPFQHSGPRQTNKRFPCSPSHQKPPNPRLFPLPGFPSGPAIEVRMPR